MLWIPRHRVVVIGHVTYVRIQYSYNHHVIYIYMSLDQVSMICVTHEVLQLKYSCCLCKVLCLTTMTPSWPSDLDLSKDYYSPNHNVHTFLKFTIMSWENHGTMTIFGKYCSAAKNMCYCKAIYFVTFIETKCFELHLYKF